jgi:hexosaminidase
MPTFHVDPATTPHELRTGLAEICSTRSERFAPSGTRLRFEPDPRLPAGGLDSRRDGDGIVVRYHRPTAAFRALGRLLGAENDAQAVFSETTRFDLLGVMFDCSRGGVLTIDSVKAFLRRLALMGFNGAMLYMEDTFELPGEPFFGYLRGGYSARELRELDDYAHALGIELMPSIQALAHLEQVLQWPAFAKYRDTHYVLLAEDEATYRFIGRMLDAATEPLRSKRININIDEAHGLGTGRYRKINGFVEPSEILRRHLKKVAGMCAERGLKTMIASDMFFRLGCASGHYYDPDTVIPKDVAEDVPQNLQLIYWDYYHTDSAFYEDWIDRHRAMGKEPLMCGSVWTWNRLWANLPFSFATTEACLTAAKRKGVKETVAAMWGDDGMECDIHSALPGLQFYAEHAYADTVDQALMRRNFAGSCAADFDGTVRASAIDQVPGIDQGPEPKFEFGMKTAPHVGKLLLWQDPLLSVLDPQVAHLSLSGHYRGLARELDAAAAKPGGERLGFPARIAEVLALKCELRRDLAAAYARGDKTQLRALAEGPVRELIPAVERLWRAHRAMWLSLYRPFGWEMIELRYGGLLARLHTLHDRLLAHVERGEPIPELAATLHRIWDTRLDDLPEPHYPRMKTPAYPLLWL